MLLLILIKFSNFYWFFLMTFFFLKLQIRGVNFIEKDFYFIHYEMYQNDWKNRDFI